MSLCTLQATTQRLSVPHLMCRRSERRCTTARRCCGVLVILTPDTKLPTYLLTYHVATAIPWRNSCMPERLYYYPTL